MRKILSKGELSLSAINKVNVVAGCFVLVGSSRGSGYACAVDGCFNDLFHRSMSHCSRSEGLGGYEGAIVLVDLKIQDQCGGRMHAPGVCIVSVIDV